MTRSCTAKARSSAKCPATNGGASPTRAPITASCGGIRARSCCSWGRSSARRANGISIAGSTGGCSTTRRIRVCAISSAISIASIASTRRFTRATARARAFNGSSWTTPITRSSPSPVLATDRSKPVVVVSNFTPVTRESYRLGLPRAGRWREILNSDATVYGGSGLGNLGDNRRAPGKLRLVSGQRGDSAAAARDFLLRI